MNDDINGVSRIAASCKVRSCGNLNGLSLFRWLQSVACAFWYSACFSICNRLRRSHHFSIYRSRFFHLSKKNLSPLSNSSVCGYQWYGASIFYDWGILNGERAYDVRLDLQYYHRLGVTCHQLGRDETMGVQLSRCFRLLLLIDDDTNPTEKVEV